MSASERIARSRAESHRDHAKDDDDFDGVVLRQTRPPKLMPPRRDSRTRNHHTSVGTFYSVGLKRTLGLGVFAFFVAMLLILDLLNRFPGPRVLTPITASSKLMESPHPQVLCDSNFCFRLLRVFIERSEIETEIAFWGGVAVF